MDRELPQPDRDRLSVLTALVLVAYILTRVVVLPALAADVRILGLLIRVQINTLSVMLALAGALAAAGADWLIRAHPWHKPSQSTRQHWIVPGLAALGAGAILARIPEGPAWWIGLGLAVVLLLTVLVTEFVLVNSDDPRYDGAAIGVTALAYLLLAGCLFAIRASGLRATFAIPLIFIAATAVAWRLLLLDGPRPTTFSYALVIGLAAAQIAWGLHYWPIAPLRSALVLGLAVYIGTGLVQAHQRGGIDLPARFEFAAVTILALLGIAVLR